MSVLSLFHPNPHDRQALKPGYSRSRPEPIIRSPEPKEEPKEKQEDKSPDSEGKQDPPKITDPNMKFIEYKVRASDDLDVWNVAATYGVRVEDIRRYNRRVVFDYLDNVIGETIWIPINVQEGDHIPRQPEADPKKIAEFKFVKDTGCSHSEAKYYLEDAEWDFDTALKTFREDVQWEKSKESRDKAAQLEKLKLETQTVTPTEKLAAAIAPSTTTTTLPTPSAPSDFPSTHSSINFPPPSYSFEGLQGSVSMQAQPSSPPPWEPQSQMKQLKKPLLESSQEY